MTATGRTCRKCRTPLPERAPGAPGRPRIYCSTGCREATKLEIRRLDRAVEAVEEQIRFCRFGWYGRTPADEPHYEPERVRLEQRLRELLDDDTTTTEDRT